MTGWGTAPVSKRAAAFACVLVTLASFGAARLAATQAEEARDTLVHDQQVEVREAAIAGCERGNALRFVLDSFILAAVDARVADGDLAVAKDYRALHGLLVTASTAHPKAAGSVQVDCQTAFPPV